MDDIEREDMVRDLVECALGASAILFALATGAEDMGDEVRHALRLVAWPLCELAQKLDR